MRSPNDTTAERRSGAARARRQLSAYLLSIWWSTYQREIPLTDGESEA